RCVCGGCKDYSQHSRRKRNSTRGRQSNSAGTINKSDATIKIFNKMKRTIIKLFSLAVVVSLLSSCNNSGDSSKNGDRGALASNVAERVYVAPGEHDEYYAFISGGYSGNMTVYGLPSGRM